MEEEDSVFDMYTHIDWFFGDNECQFVVHSLLDEIEVPLLTSSSLPVDFHQLNILEMLAADYFTLGDDGYRPEKKVIYKVQDSNGDLMKGEVLPVMSHVTDRIAWLMSLSIQHTVASVSPLFVPILAVGYFPQQHALSKLMILTPLYQESWHTFIVKNLDLPWFDKLTLAMSLVEALYIIHSRNIYIEGFSADHIIIDFDGNLRLQGPFSMHDYPMDYINFQPGRNLDHALENPYHNNIQALGVLLLEMVLDVDRIPSGSGDRHDNDDNSTGGITQDMICEAFMEGCPDKLEALILWCIDSDPFLIPTMKHCRDEMRSIYIDFCQTNHIVIEAEEVDSIEEDFKDIPYEDDQEGVVESKVEDVEELDVFVHPGEPLMVEELPNGEIVFSPMKEKASPVHKKATLSGLNEKMREAAESSSGRKKRAQHGYQVLDQVEQQIQAMQHFLAEELHQLQDPYSQTSQNFSSDEEVDDDEDDEVASLTAEEQGNLPPGQNEAEQYRYLEKVLMLYDELDAVRQQIDELCEYSFPQGIQASIERYRSQDTSTLIATPNEFGVIEGGDYGDYEVDAFLHCDGRDHCDSRSRDSNDHLANQLTNDQDAMQDHLACDTMDEELELSTTRTFIVRNAMTNQYIQFSESPTNVELMYSTTSLSQVDGQDSSNMEPELMTSRDFVSYVEEVVIEVDTKLSVQEKEETDHNNDDEELLIIPSPVPPQRVQTHDLTSPSSPALSLDSKQVFQDAKSMDSRDLSGSSSSYGSVQDSDVDCRDLSGSSSSYGSVQDSDDDSLSSSGDHHVLEESQDERDLLNLTCELEGMEYAEHQEDDVTDAYVALTICELVSELLQQQPEAVQPTASEENERNLELEVVRSSIEEMLAVLETKYAEELNAAEVNLPKDIDCVEQVAVDTVIPFSTALCPTFVPFQVLGDDDVSNSQSDDETPTEVIAAPSNEEELGTTASQPPMVEVTDGKMEAAEEDIPPPPALTPLGSLFPDISVPVRKSLLMSLMQPEDTETVVSGSSKQSMKTVAPTAEVEEVVVVTDNHLDEALSVPAGSAMAIVDSTSDSVTSVPSEVVLEGSVDIPSEESLTPFSADYPDSSTMASPANFSPVDMNTNATPLKSGAQSQTESPSALSVGSGSSNSKFRKIMRSLNLDVKQAHSSSPSEDETSPLKLADLHDPMNEKENSPLNTSRTTLSSHTDLARSRTPDAFANRFQNSSAKQSSPPISNFLQSIRQLDSLYQEELEVDYHNPNPPETGYRSLGGSGQLPAGLASRSVSSRMNSTSPIGRMIESYQSTISPPAAESQPPVATTHFKSSAPKQELHSALHTFLQLVQKCNDTNNRTRDIVNNLDHKLHRQISNPSSSSTATAPMKATSPSIYDVYRQASPKKIPNNFAAADKSGKSYSSPERNRILEASKKKAAAVAAFQKSQSSVTEKLSKFKNSKSFAISPPKKRTSSDSQSTTWGSSSRF